MLFPRLLLFLFARQRVVCCDDEPKHGWLGHNAIDSATAGA